MKYFKQLIVDHKRADGLTAPWLLLLPGGKLSAEQACVAWSAKKQQRLQDHQSQILVVLRYEAGMLIVFPTFRF